MNPIIFDEKSYKEKGDDIITIKVNSPENIIQTGFDNTKTGIRLNSAETKNMVGEKYKSGANCCSSIACTPCISKK
jgi:hypothetical protein